MLNTSDRVIRDKPRIALARSEAVTWRGRGIVIDLFRFSNTICALLESGRTDVKVYPSPAMALSAHRQAKGSDIFSEINLGVEQFDNSPYTALYDSDPSRPAISVTNSGSPAAGSLLLASEILVGCFANFPALAAYCLSAPQPTLIVPACLFYDVSHVEDMICARALLSELEGRDDFPAALEEIHSSGRVLDFMAYRPETGKRDMELVLKKGWTGKVPAIKFKAGAGIVGNVA
jgi:phosphosulfolactate phosphohydrolase-like enzyme